MIGWAYLVVSTLYLALRREHLAALLAAAVVLMCLFFADRTGTFEHWKFTLGGHVFHPTSVVSFGETLGSQASITMLGAMIGAMLLPMSVVQTPLARMRLAGILTLCMCLAALLLHRAYGIN